MKNIGNMGKLMAQVQKMQDDMKKTQDELANIECEGQSGAGLVKISVNGQGRIVSLNIDPSLLKESEKEVLEDLIIAAFQDAKTKTDKLSHDEMSKITQGIALPPGFNLPFWGRMDLFFACVLSYFCGSIPFGLLICKFFLKKDVRSIGSGNIGATNVLRAGGKKYALLTVLFDIAKGIISVLIASDHKPYVAFFAVVGHIFPIWLKFKGGKGVATSIGTYIALWPFLGAFLLGFWLLMSKIRRQSSFASLSTLFAGAIFSLHSSYYGLVIFALVLWMHRENLKRLKQKTEPYL